MSRTKIIMDQTLESCSKPSAVLENPYLESTMKNLFEKRSRTGDIKFMVDGEEIRAHRCVMAALSPKYDAQFYGDLAELDTINVQDVSPSAFKEFLQFFYAEDVTLTLDNIEDVLTLAKQSLVDGLVDECTNFIMDVIGVDKLLWCYKLARTYDLKPLKAFCVKSMGNNIKSLFKTADFVSCKRSMLCRILDLDPLNCKETDVFDACIAWARAKCERDSNDASNTAHLRLALGEAFLKIRFCSMNVEQFATISRQYEELFSPQESIEVFQAIALKASGVHSSTFGASNSRPRKSMQPCLECLFAKEPRVPFDSMTGICRFDLETDKAIELNGLILCNKIDADFRVGIQVAEEQVVYPKIHETTSENNTRIVFQPPFRINANERSMILVKSDALKQPNSSLYGFELENQITQNGVTFASKSNTTNPNLIERLLFNIVDNA